MAKRFVIRLTTKTDILYLVKKNPCGCLSISYSYMLDQAHLYKAKGHATQTISGMGVRNLIQKASKTIEYSGGYLEGALLEVIEVETFVKIK